MVVGVVTNPFDVGVVTNSFDVVVGVVKVSIDQWVSNSLHTMVCTVNCSLSNTML